MEARVHSRANIIDRKIDFARKQIASGCKSVHFDISYFDYNCPGSHAIHNSMISEIKSELTKLGYDVRVRWLFGPLLKQLIVE